MQRSKPLCTTTSVHNCLKCPTNYTVMCGETVLLIEVNQNQHRGLFLYGVLYTTGPKVCAFWQYHVCYVHAVPQSCTYVLIISPSLTDGRSGVTYGRSSETLRTMGRIKTSGNVSIGELSHPP